MTSNAVDCVVAVWPAPRRVHACVTTRAGGVSDGRYASFNLASHVGDDPSRVAVNRARLSARGVPDVRWLNQVHGTQVVDTGADSIVAPTADAAWSSTPARACAVLTADCLPVLLCDRAGTLVAAAHCGWRGLANGVLTELVRALPVGPHQLLAWLGPAISCDRYEVGNDVRDALLAGVSASSVASALRPGREPGKWQADLEALARSELRAVGVGSVYGGGFCTYDDARFYSYRRDGVTGRMAALIWLSA